MARKGFLDGYKTYDPDREGYGNASQWRQTFFKSMTPDEAARILMSRDPYEILEIPYRASMAEIKAAFKKLILKWHPDRNKDPKATEISQLIIAAYTYLTQ